MTGARAAERSERPGVFGRDVGLLLAGTVLAQAVPILLSPVYTRVYSPESFGAWAAFTAVAAICSVTVTGRYELAVLLPDTDEDAAGVLCLALTLALAGSAGLAMLAWAFREAMTSLVGPRFPPSGILLLCASAAMLGSWQAMSYWANRRRNYRRIAASSIVQQVAAGAAIVGLGVGLHSPTGLIAGTMFGQGIACLTLGVQIWREDHAFFTQVTARGVRQAAVRFYRFPLFNLPYSILTTASVRVPVLLLTAFQSLVAAGYVGFSRSVLFAPVTFVSASIGRVYYRAAASGLGSARLERLTFTLLDLMARAGPGGFALLFVWTPEIFAGVFGAEWRAAGELARPLIPGAFGFLFTSWPERIFEVAQRQSLSLRIQLVCDGVTVVVVASLLAAGLPPLQAMIAYGVLATLYNIAYLWGVFRAGGFAMAGFFQTLRIAGLTFLVAVAIMMAVRAAAGPTGAGFLVSGGLLLAWYAWLWRTRGRQWRHLIAGET